MGDTCNILLKLPRMHESVASGPSMTKVQFIVRGPSGTFPAFLKARRGRWAVPCGQNPSYFIFNKDFFFWHPRALQIPLLFSLCIQVLSLLWASLLLIKNWAAQASYMDGIASLSGCVSCMQNSPHFQLPWGLLHTEAFSLLSVSRQLVENRLCHQRGEHKGCWPQPRHVSESHFCRH